MTNGVYDMNCKLIISFAALSFTANSNFSNAMPLSNPVKTSLVAFALLNGGGVYADMSKGKGGKGKGGSSKGKGMYSKGKGGASKSSKSSKSSKGKGKGKGMYGKGMYGKGKGGKGKGAFPQFDMPSPEPTCFDDEPMTPYPTVIPTALPSSYPSGLPSRSPSFDPSNSPSFAPTIAQTDETTETPTGFPSVYPSADPSQWPSGVPSFGPTFAQTDDQTGMPTDFPSAYPSADPSQWPSEFPSFNPTIELTDNPTGMPTGFPSAYPSTDPSPAPSVYPSDLPSVVPSAGPSVLPSETPSAEPSTLPSDLPSSLPSDAPSVLPSKVPSDTPSQVPSNVPTEHSVCIDKDYYLMLDSSGSIGSNEWDKITEIAKTIVENLDPGNSNIRFALIRFSDEVDVLFTPFDQVPRNDVYDITENLAYAGGDTHTLTAINHVIDVYDNAVIDNEDVYKSEIILITDGRVAPNSEIPCPLTEELNNRGIGVHIVTHGEVDLSEVECLTQLDDSSEPFNGDDILSGNATDFYDRICCGR